MTSDKKGAVVSLSGDPIYRYGQEPGWQPVQGEMCLEQISAHIEKHLGGVETVFHEVVSDTVHIDVHVVPATADFPFVRLVTSGMSDLPMSVPEGIEVPKYLELQATLPADWRLDSQSFQDEAWYWPVRMLKILARFPHKHSTWLGWGHSMPNGDPAEPYAANTAFNGVLILPSVTTPIDFHTLRIDDEKEIAFMSMVPLYEEEMALKLRKGSDALLEKFDKHDVTDIIDIARVNVAKKRFGLF